MSLTDANVYGGCFFFEQTSAVCFACLEGFGGPRAVSVCVMSMVGTKSFFFFTTERSNEIYFEVFSSKKKSGWYFSKMFYDNPTIATAGRSY
jgi:hypothetical protein